MEGIGTVNLVRQEYNMRPNMCKSNPHMAIKCFVSNFFLIFLALHFFPDIHTQ